MNQELEACKSLVDSTFAEMTAAKQVLKSFDPLRFKFPFGSEDRATAEYNYEMALTDYQERADAFAAARKQYDDVKMRHLARKGVMNHR